MLEQTTDKELYQEYLEGNQQAFETLVKKYKNQMIYFIQRYTKSFEIAEDISQDVFVYLLLHKEQYNFEYSFKTYLYMIAKCRALNQVKKQKRVIPLQDYQNCEQTDLDFTETIFQEDKLKQIQKVMEQLKPDYQVAIYLTTFEHFKYKEVAKIMNKNIAQVKVLLNRARKKLKVLLEKEGINNEE